MKEHLKTVREETNTLVDVDTGEVISADVKQHKIIVGTTDEFLFIYSSLIGVMKQFTMPQIRVFACLLRYADGLRFQVGKAWREQTSKEIGIGERTVYTTLKELEELNVIYKSDGLYQVNPRYAFKGSSLTRKDALKAIIELGCKNC